MNEKDLIRAFRKNLGIKRSDVLVGVGDDAAVVRPGSGNWVLSVDSLVEGRHFSFPQFLPSEVGQKAFSVAFSDIAAMGARSSYALVSMGVPRGKERVALEIFRGIGKKAKAFGVEIIGGNLSSARHFFVDITAIGVAGSKVSCLRVGARPGDRVGILGGLGEAGAGFELLRKFGRVKALKTWPKLVRAQLVPSPQLTGGEILGKSGLVTSLMDVSDGLSSSLHTLAKDSGVCMEIESARLAASTALKAAERFLSKTSEDWVLNGGEDYALLFTCRSRDWSKVQGLLPKVRELGRVTKGSGVFLSRGQTRRPLLETGFDHFA
jgi:thiamine-monophosphate kinase